jgi:hypothetical protein
MTSLFISKTDLFAGSIASTSDACIVSASVFGPAAQTAPWRVGFNFIISISSKNVSKKQYSSLSSSSKLS